MGIDPMRMMLSKGHQPEVLRFGCHCGNIRLKLTTSLPPQSLPVRVCRCSFCAKQGARYTSEPDGELRVRLEAPELVTRYAFEHGTAQFLSCQICGVLPLVLSRIEGQLYAMLNINTADRPEAFSAKPRVVPYYSETKEERLRRRKLTWIGKVEVVEG